ncbi:MAG: branched-chain amino acid transport system substrate-binding protein [Micromonosporaceae bacterium]|nr:branched-chain amino acid transport system substrate-binding protein [Micromonosporaceae bacterium]
MVVGSPRRARATVFHLLLMAVLAGCGGPGQPTVPLAGVTIGLLTPATGSGIDALRGAQLAVDVINHSYPDLPVPLAAGSGLPGLAGRTVALVSGDTQGTPDEGTNQVAAVVAKRAVGVVAADSADVTVAVGSQTQRLRIPLVDASSTADYITELGMDWYFRTVPSDRLLAETAFALLQRQFAGTAKPRVAILTEAGAQDSADAVLVRDLAQRAGYTVVSRATISEQPDVSEQGKQLEQSQADVLLALANSRAAAAAMSRVAARAARPVPVLGFGPGFDEVPQDPGLPTVILRTSSWSAELAQRSPAAKAVTDLYVKRFGSPMTDTAANVFTATMTLAEAIDAAGSDDPATIRSALRQISQPATQVIMPWNGVRFDANGQNQLAGGVVEGRATTGFRVVFPRELAAGPLIWTATNGAGQ